MLVAEIGSVSDGCVERVSRGEAVTVVVIDIGFVDGRGVLGVGLGVGFGVLPVVVVVVVVRTVGAGDAVTNGVGLGVVT